MRRGGIRRLVCTGDKYGSHTEYAYDGAGRRYQERTVNDVESTPYASGIFQYRSPVPRPTLTAMGAAGDDGLIAAVHTDFDAAGNATAQYWFELNHTDTNGLYTESTSSYVRRTVFNWYDGADRLAATADYGAGDGTSSTANWKCVSYTPPSRPSPALTWTDDEVYDGYALLTTYEYDAATGRQSAVAVGVKQNSSNTDKTVTKTFYDDLGRRLFVVENHTGSYNPQTGSPASSADANRTTGWEYNGLGNVTELTAYNSDSTAQPTKYFYQDPYNASLVTHTVYPDSSSTPSSGTDLVKHEYNLDGSLKKMTDQREVVHEYTYNTRRQLELDAATATPSPVDSAIKSIKRTYDARGRLDGVFSYATTDGSGTVENGIWINYTSDPQTIQAMWQSHQGSTEWWLKPRSYNIPDMSNTGTIMHNGGRLALLRYPNLAEVQYRSGYDTGGLYQNPDNYQDRLHQFTMLKFTPNGGSIQDVAAYKYNGVDRLVETDYVVPDVRRRMFDPSTNYNYTALDRFGRVVRSQWDDYGGSITADQFNYAYDYAGNRLSRDNPSRTDRDEVYEYDGLLRLKNAQRGAYSSGSISSRQFEQDWTLDALGNWPTFKERDTDAGATWDLTDTREHNGANEITFLGPDNPAWTTPAYDAAGNMTSMPDPGGPDVLSLDVKYDAWNRAVEFSLGGATYPLQLTCEYDGLNRRIVKSVYATGSLSHRIHYYYNDKWQVIEERKEVSGTEDPDPINQYVWHPHYVDSLAMRRYDADTDGNVAENADGDYYYLQDANYNVTAVANSSGAVVERYAYTPYGQVTVLNGAADFDSSVTEWTPDSVNASDIGNTCLYTGRELDWETGLQINRNRYYAAHLGRWLSRDPVGDRVLTFTQILPLTVRLEEGELRLTISNKLIALPSGHGELLTVLLSGYANGPNTYTYGGDIPINERDPNGLWTLGGEVGGGVHIGIINFSCSIDLHFGFSWSEGPSIGIGGGIGGGPGLGAGIGATIIAQATTAPGVGHLCGSGCEAGIDSPIGSAKYVDGATYRGIKLGVGPGLGGGAGVTNTETGMIYAGKKPKPCDQCPPPGKMREFK